MPYAVLIKLKGGVFSLQDFAESLNAILSPTSPGWCTLRIYSKIAAMKNKREITIRVTEQEFAMLESHCEAVGRTKTDILREFIRSLATASDNSTNKAQV